MPIMSPSRPVTGVATAAASSVAVMAQELLDGEAPRSFGRSGTIGITRDCISENTIPPKARAATTALALGAVALPSSPVRGEAWDMVEPP
ncbi:hypothetical protein SAURM35S_05668 [Streptomyces aurantiogriseus]